MEIEKEKFTLQGLEKVTEYSNGTKKLECSLTIQNICAMLAKIRINLTKVVSLEEFKALQKTCLPYKKEHNYELTFTTNSLKKEQWDNLPFVLPPGNETIWVK
ncbi:MAG: hypothetical protein QXJ02_05455 [Candidatus Bathyarchaeia archaeon]